jgi:hypothetical protein
VQHGFLVTPSLLWFQPSIVHLSGEATVHEESIATSTGSSLHRTVLRRQQRLSSHLELEEIDALQLGRYLHVVLRNKASEPSGLVENGGLSSAGAVSDFTSSLALLIRR